MAYRYVIFDFDGTLADTNSGIVQTFQATFAEMGIPDPGRDTISATIGLMLKDGFLQAAPCLSDSEADRAVAIYRRLFNSIGIPQTTAFPGVLEMLDAVHNAGVRMSIASSRSHQTLELLAGRLGIAQHFELYCGAEDVVNHKPAPDMVNLILERFQLDPKDVLVVGDATYDLLMGNSAGCDSCGVTWGNQKRAQLKTASPDYIVDTFDELLKVIIG